VALALPLVAAQPLPQQQANAAQVSGFLEDPGHPLGPGANETIVLRIHYVWSEASVAQPNPDSGDLTNSSTAPTKITYVPKAIPTWIDNVSFDPPVTWAPSTANGAPLAPGASEELKVNVILHVKPGAPALNHQNLTISLHADANGATGAADGTTTELMLRPADNPAIKIEPKGGNTTAVKGGRGVPITFLVHNVGNDETTVQLNVSTRPQDSIVDFPPVVTLRPGETQPVDVVLRVPWTYGEEGSLELSGTPVSGDATGAVAKATVDVVGQSAVPSVEPLLLLTGIGLLALFHRRRVA
jgi:hypothetical protein